MNLAPVTLEHGEVFGKLTVLRKIKPKGGKRGPEYICGCECGTKKTIVRASDLMKGRVKSCFRCAGSSSP